MYGCTRCPAGQEICPRCRTRLCLDHAMLPGEACNECELAYSPTLARTATLIYTPPPGTSCSETDTNIGIASDGTDF
jgi:hypothetical protein